MSYYRYGLGGASGITLCLVLLSLSGLFVHAGITSFFADDFNSLSSQYVVTNPAELSVSNSLLHLVGDPNLIIDNTAGYAQVAIPVTLGSNVTVTVRVLARSFYRFQMALSNQTGLGLGAGQGGIGWNDNAVGVEFDSADTNAAPAQCGNFVWEAASNWNDSYDFSQICRSTNTWYQLQMVVNNTSVTWKLLDDTSGAVIESYSGSIPQPLRAFGGTVDSYDYSSVRYLTLSVAGGGSYDVDWIVASSPSPLPIHSGSSGSTTLTAGSRATSTTVSCSPTSVQAGQATTCTATVTDTATGTASTPTGIVEWRSSGAGTFETTTCSLSGSGAVASCLVNYTPEVTGSVIITASYGGDTSLSATTQQMTLNVSGSNLPINYVFLAGIVGGTGVAGIIIGALVTTIIRKKERKTDWDLATEGIGWSKEMTDNKEETSRDSEEIVNMLAWPGPIEEGMITAGAIREVQENEDRFRRNHNSAMAESIRTDLLSVVLVLGLSVIVLLFFKLMGFF